MSLKSVSSLSQAVKPTAAIVIKIYKTDFLISIFFSTYFSFNTNYRELSLIAQYVSILTNLASYNSCKFMIIRVKKKTHIIIVNFGRIT